ncbi:RnfABCDGE type electron transport complex subunit D [candidate division KSB1 bacterium]|nr:RnfABCDGE type electron transport complex subunit D [candidate division KSB1 bacterium]
MENKFYVSSSPHITAKDSIQKIMFDVVLALVPAMIAAIYFFGYQAGWIILLCVATCVGSEAVIQKLMKKKITIIDGSAIVTGILLAFNLPPEIPWWMPIIGSVFAIIIGKHCFGGLGYNPMNPALLGRAFLLASWPTYMTIFKTEPTGGTLSGITAITSATPLNVMKNVQEILKNQALRQKLENTIQTVQDSTLIQDAQKTLSTLTEYAADQINQAQNAFPQLSDASNHYFFGRIGGCLGETSVLALLIGAAYLLYKRHIGLKIPMSYLGTVALLSWIFGGVDGLFTGDWIFHILTGGLILGAFFMATDMVTSPVTYWGQIIFGAGCGLITVIIRLIGGYPEGVSYSILLMNLTVPLLDRLTRPRIFGEVKTK